jgi:homoserine dehydrogenase
MLSLAMYGCGLVGSELLRLIERSDLETKNFRVEAVCVTNPTKHTEFSRFHFTDDIDWLMSSDGHNVVVDMLPGVEPSFKIISRALLEGKKVLTCNKELIGVKGKELVDITGTNEEKLYLKSIPASASPCFYDSIDLTNKNLLDYDFHDLFSFRNAGGKTTAEYLFNEIVALVDDANARCTDSK